MVTDLSRVFQHEVLKMLKKARLITPLLKTCCPGITQVFNPISVTDFILPIRPGLATWPDILSGPVSARKEWFISRQKNLMMV